jgi:D-arabinose 1-dehydrogenase-like Zn-dependent alcohol dehydrogenase
MAKMKVAQVPKPGADFEIVEREIPNPGAGHVRIRVQACGKKTWGRMIAAPLLKSI